MKYEMNVNPKFVESVSRIKERLISNEDLLYFFRVTMNSRNFHDSIFFQTKEECEQYRIEFLRMAVDLYNK